MDEYLYSLIDNSKKVIEQFGLSLPERVVYCIETMNSSWGTHVVNNGLHEIAISRQLYEDRNDHSIETTLIHEMLHACFPNDGHRKNWKKYADLISKNTDYCIKRISSCKEKEFAPTNFMFKAVCKGCGNEWYFFKPSKKVRDIAHGKCRCPHCKSTKFIVYNQFGGTI